MSPKATNCVYICILSILDQWCAIIKLLSLSFQVPMVRQDSSAQVQVRSQEAFKSGLLATPHSIAILGQLSVISTSIDFPINQGERKNFEYLLHPDSFRACLAQISNMGREAFLTAHVGMDAIAIHTKRVPGYIEEVIEIFEEGEPDDMADVPLSLDGIKAVVDDCNKEAEKMVVAFDDVMKALSELQQACIAADGSRKTESKETAKDLKVLEVETEGMKDYILKEEESKKKYEKMLEKDQERLDRSMNYDHSSFASSVKKGFAAVANNLASASVDIAEGVSQALVGNLTGSLSSFWKVGGNLSKSLKEAKEDDSDDSDEDELELEDTHSSTTHRQIQFQAQITNHLEMIKEEAFEDQNLKQIIGKMPIEALKNVKEKIVNSMKDAVSIEAGNLLMDVCNKSIELCQKITKTDGSQGQGRQLLHQLNGLIEQNSEIKVESKKKKLFGKSRSQKANESKRALRMKIAKDAIKDTQSLLEEAKDRERKNYRENMDLQHRMTKLLEEQASQKDILKVLNDGIRKFAQLLEQWRHLQAFFKKIGLMIEEMRAPFKDFSAQIENLDGKQLTKMQLKKLKKYGEQTGTAASNVQGIALTYHEISQVHFQPMLSNLGACMAIDIDDSQAKKKVQKKVLEMSNNAYKFIKDKIDTDHEEMEKKMQSIAQDLGLDQVALDYQNTENSDSSEEDEGKEEATLSLQYESATIEEID